MFLVFRHCFLYLVLAYGDGINLLNFEFISNYYEEGNEKVIGKGKEPVVFLIVIKLRKNIYIKFKSGF